MIIVRISGGIGNQLFQYALGRALSLKNGDELKLDTHVYDLDMEPGRSFKLPHFAIPGIGTMKTTKADLKKAGISDPAQQGVFSKMIRGARRSIKSSKPLHARRVVLEPKFAFCPEILEIQGDCYLSGVWQSEKYFSRYSDQIRKDLAPAAPLSADAERFKAEIGSEGSVSLHVRRGDMMRDRALSEKHGSLGAEYYRKALAHISAKVPSPRIFVFSDDIGWCKANLGLDLPVTYVEGKDLKDYEELHLMSLCRHHITANSTFSWWAAWLDPRPDKIVIAPQRWFNTDADTSDLIPDQWIRM